MTTTSAQPDPRTLDARAETTAAPQLCGFLDGTSSITCPTSHTCKFNTDLYAVGCCSDDTCDWFTTCCDYNPWTQTNVAGTYTPECGGPNRIYRATCSTLEYPWCMTGRWENGFVKFYCTSDPRSRMATVVFTSAGETTAREGLVRLTGRNGPATALTQGPTTVTATTVVTAEVTAGSGPNAGAIAGGVVGGVAVGAILTFLGLLLAGYFRKRQVGAVRESGSPYTPMASPFGQTPELGQRQ